MDSSSSVNGEQHPVRAPSQSAQQRRLCSESRRRAARSIFGARTWRETCAYWATKADALAREASALPQHETRIDTGTVQKAVARSATATWKRSWPDGWSRAIMGNRLPGPVEEEDRLAAVDVHQLRAGHWSCSEQYLHRIGRRPTPGCGQCNNVECPAARCRVCSEEADMPRHVLLRHARRWRGDACGA